MVRYHLLLHLPILLRTHQHSTVMLQVKNSPEWDASRYGASATLQKLATFRRDNASPATALSKGQLEDAGAVVLETTAAAISDYIRKKRKKY